MRRKYARADECFLKAVANEMKPVVAPKGFTTEPWDRTLGFGYGLKVKRSACVEWQIGGSSDNQVVDVHFDATRIGQINLDVEVSPYVQNRPFDDIIAL